MFNKICCLALFSLGSVIAGDVKCRALAMAGGGTKGAFEVGVLYGMYHAQPNAGNAFDYDVVSGISAGAINAGAMGVLPKDDTASTVQILSDTWASMQQDNLYQNWWGGAIFGLTNHEGVYDTSVLYDFVKKFFKDHGNVFHRKVTVAAGNVETGSYQAFKETHSDFPRSVLASASIPLVFPPQKIDGSIFMDGGTMWNTNLVSAIHRCREIVTDDSDIILDIVQAGSNELESWDDEDQTTINNYMRFNTIKEYHTGIGDIHNFRLAFKDVNFRYYVEPTGAVASGTDMLNTANATNTWPMQMLGRQDGAAVVNAGEGYTFGKMSEYENSPELQKKYTLGKYMNLVFKDLDAHPEDVKKTQEAHAERKELLAQKKGEAFIQ